MKLIWGLVLTLFISFYLGSIDYNIDSFSINKKEIHGIILKPVNEKKGSYYITNQEYRKNNIKINYPKITNLNDAKRQNTINTLLKDEALKIIDYYDTIEKKLTLEINYTIKLKTNNLLSIAYSGLGYVKGAAYPNNHFYTTNIDINNGNRLRLKDIIEIDDELIKKIQKGNFKAPKNRRTIILNKLDSKNTLKNFSKSDSLANITEGRDNYIFTYLTPSSLGISINVIHALGDHIEFEIDYQHILENIKLKYLKP
ncbi:PdaC/SigV domain-containing protein [Dethiothermospora halolimnae]|uniref:PdaC/SigV domain-containing protein n=1 Tax=Dethiothermospora halolimnae TaxID=3114390 RepID=UPI003CCBD249